MLCTLDLSWNLLVLIMPVIVYQAKSVIPQSSLKCGTVDNEATG